MQLRSRIVLALVSVFVLYLGVDYAIQHYVVLPRFLLLEREEAVKDLTRYHQAIEREVDHLQILCHDWAAWDDTYEYVEDHNRDYEEVNFTDTTYIDSRLNIICVVDHESKFVYRECRAVGGEESIVIEEFAADQLPPDHPLLQHESSTRSINGLLMTEHGPLMVSSEAIVTSENEGPIRGALIMGRFLDSTAVEGIAEQTRVSATLHAINDPQFSSKHREKLAMISASEPVLIDDDDAMHLHVFSSIKDICSNPILLSEAEVPRDISARGQEAVQYAVSSLLLAGLIVLGILLLLLQRIVIGPIMRLTGHAIAIGSTGDLTSRLDLQRSDEIGTLASQFNTMVKKLSNSRSQLMNLSREAGMADVAAGVLHNVGNVMTNVNVITSALGERVSRSKLSGLNKAAAMIREHQDDLGAFLTDDAKGKQLPAYLAQLAAQLEQEQSDLLQEIDTLGGNLQHVNQILDAQQQYATRTKALEPTSMEELLRNAIAMVQASLDNHQVSLDLSCEAIPTAMIDRSKLLQTIVNLLTNAKDAVKSKLEGERLIRLELTQLGSDQFRVSVVDNGQGIEAADLTRIFAEGFTTKPGGHGQGLHYCALAAKEMHGTLTVESDGVGYGAKFTLELPLVTVEERITV